jgi:hypothetical protein
VQRYWFEFVVDLADWAAPSSVLRAGCGVTGYDVDDCLRIISDKVLGGANPPTIRRVVEDIDVSTLDQKHVVPNMGSIFRRGIWFPLGYEESA